MSSSSVGIRLATAFVVLLLQPTRLPGATVEQVEKSLDRAKAYVYAQQKNGHWEESPKRRDTSDGNDVTGSQWGGRTAIATLALMTAGENPQDKKLAPAIAFLKKADMVGTYALGVRCQVWLALPQTAETKTLMKKDLTRLLGLMKTKGQARGLYDYDATGGATTYSLSRSQYAVLGVWAAAQAGQEVSSAFWREVEQAWVGHQDKSGGWAYKRGRNYPLTPGITSVGVATLFITQDQLYFNRGADCKDAAAPNTALEKGIRWMAEHFDQVAGDKEYARDYPYATLYGVERVGVAGGLKYFGDVDWYAKGADYLVRTQRDDGSWYGGDAFIGELADTCFGVIFLARGRAPVVVNKLDYSTKRSPARWNQRPRDVANLVRWTATAAEREMNWQVVTLQSPLEDLLEAPILYLAGNDVIKLDEAAREKLKAYAEAGGLIVGNADCGDRKFANTFHRLGEELFTEYEFRELPADHSVYQTFYRREKWRKKPNVMGLSNGVRELMLLIPQADPARAWQTRTVGGKEELWQLAANVVFYTTDPRTPRFKGQGYWVAPDPKVKPTSTLKLARIRYEGNWDPEPGGWRRMVNVMRNRHKVALEAMPADPTAAGLKGVAVAHLTGTSRLKLDDAARGALRAFVERGGTLIVDAAGGAEPFATSAASELKAIFPKATLQTLPADHAVYSVGGPLKSVGYRAFARRALTGLANTPRIQGISQDDRVAVFFSREDLSAGLVGQTVDGVIGYDPPTATELMTRLLLYASRATKPAAKVD